MNNFVKLMMDIWTIRHSKLFDSVFYLSTYKDVREADVDPVAHYARFGWIEGRDPSDFFSTSYYLSNNPDVKEKGGNPLVHFIRFGARENRNPSE